MDKRQPSASDRTDEEWKIIAPFVPRVKRGGRPTAPARREIVKAIVYGLRAGCPWPMRPHDRPSWKTVSTHFRNWRRVGSPPPAPPSGIVNPSRRRKRGARGYDAGKKIKGSKRHMLTDTLGVLWEVRVHAADRQDREAPNSSAPPGQPTLGG